MDCWYFHQDNAPAHPAKACIDCLKTSRLKLLEYPTTDSKIYALFLCVKIKIVLSQFFSGEDLLRVWDNVCVCVTIPKEM